MKSLVPILVWLTVGAAFGGTAVLRWLEPDLLDALEKQFGFDRPAHVRFGTHFLSRMLGKYKDVAPLAIASYNVGPGNLDRWLSHRSDLDNWKEIGASPDDDIWMDELPWAETSFYVKAVMRNYLLYKLLHQNYDKLSSPTWKEARI